MRAVFFLVTIVVSHWSAAQDQTSLWLRYSFRIPLDTNWTMQMDPDFRTELAPNAWGFTQWLFRSDFQRRLNDVHTVGFGAVGVYNTDEQRRVEMFEWRPQVTLLTRPRSFDRRLLLRGRVEWRQQYFSTSGETASRSFGTLRCRALVQYEIPFARNKHTMTRGFRNQAEIMVRAYTDTPLGVMDQLRLSSAWVMPASKKVEMEVMWMWFLREVEIWQQWFRIAFVQRLG